MDNKTTTITIRLTAEQKELIETLANQSDMTVSGYIKSALLDKTGDKRVCALKESESESGYVNIDLMITKEQELKIIKMATELGITKQQCIRRLINEGDIYDMRINIDMADEFADLASEIRNMNRLLNGIYTVCKRADGILTKREVDNLYKAVNEINDNTSKMRASLFKTNGQLKEMAMKRLDKLIKDNRKKSDKAEDISSKKGGK